MIESVKGIIAVKNTYLLQLRDNKKKIYFPHFWGLFGGRLDESETYAKALEREIKEETNLVVKAKRKILSTNYSMFNLKKRRNTVYYECKILKKTKIILSEGKKYNFFPFNQIKELKIIPMDFVAIHTHYYKVNNYTSLYR